MKRINNIMTLVLLLSMNLLWSCSNDESTLSKAVLTSAKSLNFEAQGAAEKIITVYADADWVTEAPEWVTVTPASGTGTMDVTVSVTDNMRDGAVDNPREAALVFKGATLASRAEVTVSQDGDKYRDCKEYKLHELAALDDKTVVTLNDIVVSAVTQDGFVASDAPSNANIYFRNCPTARIGDKVSVKGSRTSDMYSLPMVECDEVTVSSAGNVVAYPPVTDITASVDTYHSVSRDYISVSGVLDGNNIIVEGAENVVSVIDAAVSLGLASLNGHLVTVTGFFAGVAAPALRMVAATVQDNGVQEVIYFFDDFEWLQPWSDKSGAGQTVENDGSGSAPQVYTAANEAGELASDALKARGYILEETPGHAIYLQKNYLKFGKTDYQAGLTLPALTDVPEHTKLKLSFDWAPMVGGTRKFDPVQLIVSITDGSQTTELEPIGHHFVNEVDKLEWLHAEVDIDASLVTRKARISIKSDGWGDTKATTGSSVYRRWFIDNIKVVKSK